MDDNDFTLAIFVAFVLGVIAFLIFWNTFQPLRERTAYLEGRYGLDHESALQLAADLRDSAGREVTPGTEEVQ